MVYVLGLLVALQLVLGQSLWKIGTERSGFELSAAYLCSGRLWGFLLSPFTLSGLLMYSVATVLYMGMLARYQYSMVQGIVVPLALIMAFLVARSFFDEKLTRLNIVGLLLLIIGIGLVTRK